MNMVKQHGHAWKQHQQRHQQQEQSQAARTTATGSQQQQQPPEATAIGSSSSNQQKQPGQQQTTATAAATPAAVAASSNHKQAKGPLRVELEVDVGTCTGRQWQENKRGEKQRRDTTRQGQRPRGGQDTSERNAGTLDCAYTKCKPEPVSCRANGARFARAATAPAKATFGFARKAAGSGSGSSNNSCDKHWRQTSPEGTCLANRWRPRHTRQQSPRPKVPKTKHAAKPKPKSKLTAKSKATKGKKPKAEWLAAALAPCEAGLRVLLWQLCRLTVLLGMCWGLLFVNLQLAEASLQAWGALQGAKLATQALVEAADKFAHVSREAAHFEPARFASIGGFTHLAMNVANFMLESRHLPSLLNHPFSWFAPLCFVVSEGQKMEIHFTAVRGSKVQRTVSQFPLRRD